jgi:hypothetical protein
MARELFIVARDRADLFRYLSQTFADADTVEIIWDRRQGERRGRANGSTSERRGVERRTRTTVEQDLRAVGYAFLALE